MFEDFDALSFDCYGTLIDWETGIARVLHPWARRSDSDLSDEQLLTAYAEVEAGVEERQPRAAYPHVLATAFRDLGERLGITLSDGDAANLGRSIPDWPAFADSHAALTALSSKFELIILSNVDRASFGESRARLGVHFSHVITAEDVGSYKPAPENFRVLKAHADAHGLRLLHVAQSLFHDHVPAAKAGLPAVWINRRHDRAGWGATPPPAAEVLPEWEFPSMAKFASVAVPQWTAEAGPVGACPPDS